MADTLDRALACPESARPGRFGAPGAHAGVAFAARAALTLIDLRGDPQDPAFLASARASLGAGLPLTPNTTAAGANCEVLWLGPDEWLLALGINLYDESCRARVESLQWELAMRALSLGNNVILEFGFWSRQERDYFRSQAEAIGASVELWFLDVPRDELWTRVQKRNAGLTSETGYIDESSLDRWFAQFEPPSPDEIHQGPEGIPLNARSIER